MKSPKKLWGTRINFMGPWSRKPVRLYWDAELRLYWDSTGDMNTPNKRGYFEEGNCSYFVSEDKKEVQRFLDNYYNAMNDALTYIAPFKSNGYQAARKHLGNLL